MIDEIIHGEALDVLRTLPDNSIDALVTDPPAGISFMGKEFDHDRGGRKFWIAWLAKIMAEALRVLKPGGHAYVWALPRTSHWTATALENAGFEIRDCTDHIFGADVLLHNFMKSLTPSQSDGLKMLLDSQSAPAVMAALFGTGFPKSHNISKAIDAYLGAEREIVGKRIDGRYAYDFSPASQKSGGIMGNPGKETKQGGIITAPATPEALAHEGEGTALKPASEHWWLCRKPLSEPTIAENVLRWGVGGLNIDKTRIGIAERDNKSWRTGEYTTNGAFFGNDSGNAYRKDKPPGRWPANVIMSHSLFCVQVGTRKVKTNDKEHTRYNHAGKQGYHGNVDDFATKGYADPDGMELIEDWECSDDCPIKLLGQQSGTLVSKWGKSKSDGGKGFFGGGSRDSDNFQGDQGTAARYFHNFSPDPLPDVPFYYAAKPSRRERDAGCEDLPEKASKKLDGGVWASNYAGGQGTSTTLDRHAQNIHPTVKSQSLMRHLIRQITPTDGIVLDCFAGSGSTLVACIHEGYHFIGIEQSDTPEEPYITIARARIQHAQNNGAS